MKLSLFTAAASFLIIVALAQLGMVGKVHYQPIEEIKK